MQHEGGGSMGPAKQSNRGGEITKPESSAPPTLTQPCHCLAFSPVLVVCNKVENEVAQGTALLLQPLHVLKDGVKVVLGWNG